MMYHNPIHFPVLQVDPRNDCPQNKKGKKIPSLICVAQRTQRYLVPSSPHPRPKPSAVKRYMSASLPQFFKVLFNGFLSIFVVVVVVLKRAMRKRSQQKPSMSLILSYEPGVIHTFIVSSTHFGLSPGFWLHHGPRCRPRQHAFGTSTRCCGHWLQSPLRSVGIERALNF